MIGQQKNNSVLYHQNYHLIEKPVITFLNLDTYQNYPEIFEKYNAQLLLFFTRAPDMFLTSSHVLKQLDYMMIFYFYLVCFTFSISYLVLPFHLVYVLQFLHLFFFNVRSQAFIKCSRKLSYTYICISSFQFSHSVMSDSLQPHGLKHARPPCPSPNPGVHSNSCPLSR